MSNSSVIREQLTFKAGLQFFLIVSSIVFTILYTMPQLRASGEQIDDTNNTIEKYKTTVENGIPFTDLKKVITATKDNNELLEVIEKNPEETKKIIKKEGTEPYLSWIKGYLANSKQDKKKLQDAKAKINSIIPTLSPISGNINEENITLDTYIRFVEQKILKDFSIESLSPLGIDGIQYKQKDGKVTNSIGSFMLHLNFKTSNGNIQKLLDFIQKSGQPDILQDDVILTELPKVMSNPLIKIHSLSLQQVLNPQFPNLENAWSISLQFFVRGSSKNDGQYLLDTFNKRNTELGKKISSAIEKCQSNTNTSSCISLKELEYIQRKYQEFNRSLAEINPEKDGNSVKTIYILSQQLQVLNSLQNEFDNIK